MILKFYIDIDNDEYEVRLAICLIYLLEKIKYLSRHNFNEASKNVYVKSSKHEEHWKINKLDPNKILTKTSMIKVLLLMSMKKIVKKEKGLWMMLIRLPKGLTQIMKNFTES